MENVFAGDMLGSSSTSSLQNDDNSKSENINLAAQLRCWVFKHNVTYSCINDLLLIL